MDTTLDLRAMGNSLPAWGKFDKVTGRIHRLEYHCADVAACFEALLEDPILESRVAAACNGQELDSVTKARLTYLAYLHDFGKVSRGFQSKISHSDYQDRVLFANKGHIGPALACCQDEPMLLALEFIDTVGTWGPGAEQLLRSTLAHHGRPAIEPRPGSAGFGKLWKSSGNYDPQAAARHLVRRGQEWFRPAFQSGPELPDQPSLAHLFAGLVCLADQIGSNEEFFEFEEDDNPEYIESARSRAREAVESLGFARRAWTSGMPQPTIRSLFNFTTARPAQEVVASAALDSQLLVLESETGSGKTEAAILRFAALWQAGLVDGLYFALPTRAAAKQLHGRVDKAMERLFPRRAKVKTVLAVPGYIQAGKAEGTRTARFSVFWEDNPDEKQRHARWAAESSRKYLSATVAVGTVDQALLAGLRIKWAHLRGASLARSLLVIDEVHASDAYMSELLSGVLRAHLAIGGHALVMSATLGSSARGKLIERSESLGFTEAKQYPYPALTVAGPGTKPCCIPISQPKWRKKIKISSASLLTEPHEIAKRAIAGARAGARVLVIRNTVFGARAVYKAVRDRNQTPLLFKVNGVPTLHHSRYAAEDRRILDTEVESALGKKRVGSDGVIVIGTQTVEQSLDIDADYLITDICPIDVLLQRIGRLHRHERKNRPAGFTTPSCEVLTPESGMETAIQGKLLRYGLGMSKSGGVYINVVGLEATRRLIEQRAVWVVPDMCRRLVEKATHPDELRNLARELGLDWAEHLDRVIGRSAAHRGYARLYALSRNEPFDDGFVFGDFDMEVRSRLGEDGPRVELRESVVGPFGEPVRTFNLPVHLFGRPLPDAEEIESASLSDSNGRRQTLEIGDHRFMYGPDGVFAEPGKA